MTGNAEQSESTAVDVLHAVLYRAAERAAPAGVGGIGTDIVEIPRVGRDIARWGERFVKRAFTKEEIDYCSAKQSPAHHFAGKLAAKEAVYKALRLRWRTAFSWTWIEILNDDHGTPTVCFRGPLETLARSKRGQWLTVSVSHAGDYAIAVAVLALDGRTAEA